MDTLGMLIGSCCCLLGDESESTTCTLTAVAAAVNQLITDLVEANTFSYSTKCRRVNKNRLQHAVHLEL
jgi:hypothetical protein